MKRYTLNLSYKQQKELGFRYDPKLNEYVYEFPVFLYKGKPNIVCKLGINNENNEIWYQVCDIKGYTYSTYYNRNYGTSKIISIIDRCIKKELQKLGAKEIKKRYRK